VGFRRLSGNTAALRGSVTPLLFDFDLPACPASVVSLPAGAAILPAGVQMSRIAQPIRRFFSGARLVSMIVAPLACKRARNAVNREAGGCRQTP
jgi:hypothetical protein